MKLLNEELKRRREERRNDKGTLWTSWLVRIILLVLALLIIRYFTNLHVLFFRDIFRSSPAQEETGDFEEKFFE